MNVAVAHPRSRTTTSIAVALSLAAAAGAASVIAGSLAVSPTAAEGWRHAAQYTARFSFLTFLPVFVARPWHQLWPSPTTRWMVLHRRALGLAFATAHFIHLYALTHFRVTTEQMPDIAQLTVGGGAYVMLTAMALTSSDRAVRALGAPNWKRLHTVGIYWIWFVFAQSYVRRAILDGLFFAPFAALVLGALALRIAAYRRKHPAAKN